MFKRNTDNFNQLCASGPFVVQAKLNPAIRTQQIIAKPRFLYNLEMKSSHFGSRIMCCYTYDDKLFITSIAIVREKERAA